MIFFLETWPYAIKTLLLFFVFLVLSIKKHLRKCKHTLFCYYILLTHPTITFLQITKIQNNSNNDLNTH